MNLINPNVFIREGLVVVYSAGSRHQLELDHEAARELGVTLMKLALEVEGDDFLRASGDCVCSICGDFYRNHPRDHTLLGVADHTGHPQPFLRRLCDGRRVKL